MAHKRILVATDLSPASDKVIGAAIGLAAELGADMWVVNVLTEESLRRMREDLPVEAAYVDTLVERVRDEVADQVRRLGGVAVAATVERGEPGEAVHKAGTDLESDLIVIGVRNRSRVGKLILGSATQEILLNAPCPVLSVPI